MSSISIPKRPGQRHSERRVGQCATFRCEPDPTSSRWNPMSRRPRAKAPHEERGRESDHKDADTSGKAVDDTRTHIRSRGTRESPNSRPCCEFSESRRRLAQRSFDSSRRYGDRSGHTASGDSVSACAGRSVRRSAGRGCNVPAGTSSHRLGPIRRQARSTRAISPAAPLASEWIFSWQDLRHRSKRNASADANGFEEREGEEEGVTPRNHR